MPVRRIGAFALMLAATLLGATPRGMAADPSSLTPRYAAAGWLGIAQTAAGPDPSTVDVLTVPAGAVVQWAGLNWGGDLGVRADGTPPRCAAAPVGTTPANPPATPDQLGTVALSTNDSPPQTVSASAVGHVTTPGGAPGYQASADVTAMIRPYGGRTVSVKLSGLQVASGPGCVGGWNLLVVYGYPGGPDPKYAPIYQSVAVYDPLLAVGGTATLTGLTTPKVGPVGSGVSSSLLAAGAPVSMTLNGRPVGVSNAAGGNGYQPSATPLPNGSLAAGASTATLGVSGAGDSFAAAVLAVGIGLPVTANLPITAAFTPTTVAVGAIAQLTLTVQNSGDIADPGVAVTAPLPAGVTIVTDNSSYNEDSGVWTIGTIPPHAKASLGLTVRVNAPGSFSSSARVSASALSLSQNPPPTPSTATIVAEMVTQPPTADPVTQPASLGQPGSGPLNLPPGGVIFGVGLFGLGLVLLLVMRVRRRSSL